MCLKKTLILLIVLVICRRFLSVTLCYLLGYLNLKPFSSYVTIRPLIFVHASSFLIYNLQHNHDQPN